MRRTLTSLLALLAAPALLLPPSAGAARGAAIDVGRIAIEQDLTPGGSYELPTIGVRNPGDEETAYVMVADPVQDPERMAPPRDWFRFEPAEFTLEPGETRPVQARLVLPSGADPGDYLVLVGAQIADERGGARVGAVAAARTTFTVEPATLLHAWWLKLKTGFDDLRPWSWLVPLVVVGILGASLLRRRYSFALVRRSA